MKWWAPVSLVVLLSGCSNPNRVVLSGGGSVAPSASGGASTAPHPTIQSFSPANVSAPVAPALPNSMPVMPTPRPVVPAGAVAAPGLLPTTPPPAAGSINGLRPLVPPVTTAPAAAGGNLITNATPTPGSSPPPVAPLPGPTTDPNQVMRNAQGQVIPPANGAAPAPVFGTLDPVLQRSEDQQNGVSLAPPGFASQVARLFGEIKSAGSSGDAYRVATEANVLRQRYATTAPMASPGHQGAYSQGESAMGTVISAANTEAALRAGQISQDDAKSAIAADEIAATTTAQSGDQVFVGP